jgi:hypothetical protein
MGERNSELQPAIENGGRPFMTLGQNRSSGKQ